jgi:hypothetical protein
MKDSQFPVDQQIQSPVLQAFTMDRKKWGPILGTGHLISQSHFKKQIAPTSVGKGKNKPDLYFAYGFYPHDDARDHGIGLVICGGRRFWTNVTFDVHASASSSECYLAPADRLTYRQVHLLEGGPV